MGALSHGLPSVLVPLGADQSHNAQRAVALGAAVALDAVRATPQDVSTAVSDLLTNDSYRNRAQRIQREINNQPGPEKATRLLESLG